MKGSEKSLKKLDKQKDQIYKEIIDRREDFLNSLQKTISNLMVKGYKGNILKEFERMEEWYLDKRYDIEYLEVHMKNLKTPEELEYIEKKKENQLKRERAKEEREWKRVREEFKLIADKPAIKGDLKRCPDCHMDNAVETRTYKNQTFGICNNCKFARIRGMYDRFENNTMYLGFEIWDNEF